MTSHPQRWASAGETILLTSTQFPENAARLFAAIIFIALLNACVPPRRKPSNVDEKRPTPTQLTQKTQPQGRSIPSKETADESHGTPPDAIFLPKQLAGRVVGVHDGDTITLIDDTNQKYKIRLAGIDAPELSQEFGRRSKSNLSDRVFGKQVFIAFGKIDRYGRIVGKILLEGGDVNLLQVHDGLAWHYKQYQDEQSQEDRDSYAEAEIRAREVGKGLWVQPNPTPPWEKRHPKK